MSAVPNDQELQDSGTQPPQNIVEEAMSWEYGLGRQTIASPVDDGPAGP